MVLTPELATQSGKPEPARLSLAVIYDEIAYIGRLTNTFMQLMSRVAEFNEIQCYFLSSQHPPHEAIYFGTIGGELAAPIAGIKGALKFKTVDLFHRRPSSLMELSLAQQTITFMLYLLDCKYFTIRPLI
jgi:hypothetical protein